MTGIERKSLLCESVLVLFLLLAAQKPVESHDISIIVKDEQGYGVRSKIRHLKFKAENLCDEKYTQVGEVEKDGGPIRIKVECKNRDWLVACPIGSIYRRTAESEPKRCREPEVVFVFGFKEIGTIFFDSESTAISSEQLSTLQEYADILKMRPDMKLLVEGHTDASGPPEYNLALSERRAFAVGSTLIAAGVPSEQITTRGFGESRPAVPSAEGVPIAQNRRVEIRFEPIQ